MRHGKCTSRCLGRQCYIASTTIFVINAMIKTYTLSPLILQTVPEEGNINMLLILWMSKSRIRVVK